ncbi:MAG TPA: copper chaperone PCu(A)C [Accumulibacter sp.]|nr:copper chaperone PCu(A)C [Accumulibacter sp.]HMW19008.1 copper chaperone PCu(A)C [Accumulibacter sp.]HMX23367.1 copper chaperone PCu(A)C [Accumulibacter sp.]HNC19039.1 copper chaperone PCu(A)C [Accumulibacter sp.]HND79606.1 copper chaperone PCu(A)C [Accumulibacter sp.]
MQIKRMVMAISLGLVAGAAWSGDIDIKDPWVRGTVVGQQATGAFMELRSAAGAALVGASSPVAAITEVHEMKMDGTVMKMRPIARLDLPAGKPVKLAPGGYHVMLISLKQPLKKGDTVPLTLQFAGQDKKVSEVRIEVPVRDLAASPTAEHAH